MNRAREIDRTPAMRTGTTARVAKTPGARLTDVAKSRAINQVREGIRVVDANGEELGNVEYIKMGDPHSTTVSPATQYDPSLIEAFFGMSEPDLPEPLPSSLLSSDDVKIDDKDWIASNHFMTADLIGSISGDTVTLTVDKDHTLTDLRCERRPTSVVTG
ncbi:MAG: hypothetical protein KY456_15100 [Chloroflexi bacterium]|nr:hypothetical protein [Chloroflexota bacterium]